MLRLCKTLGKTPAELLDGLSSEEFVQFLVLDEASGNGEAQEAVPEMDPAHFVKMTHR